MRRFWVEPDGGDKYPVFVGAGAQARVARLAPAHVAVVSNPTVFKLRGKALMQSLAAANKNAFVCLLPDGEKHKNMRSLNKLLNAFAAAGLRRDGGVVALGGGVTGDIAGFAAAVYMRGVALLQAPTTLLAQIDAAIGGKTGVNHARGKNMIGAFYQPRAVFCDTDALGSLPQREYCAGLAEAVKLGLLADAKLFAWLEKRAAALLKRDPATLEQAVARAARGKARFVAEDEKEQTGRRALLNLGHTFAHSLETTLGYGEWLHGEAVAAGLVAAARLSEEVCGFSAAGSRRIVALLRALQLPVALPSRAREAALLRNMEGDKKHTARGRRFVVLNAIGDAALQYAPEAAARRALAQTR